MDYKVEPGPFSTERKYGMIGEWVVVVSCLKRCK